MDRGGHVVFIELLIVIKTVGGGHSLVVVAEGEEGARGITVNLQFIAEFGLKSSQFFLVFLAVSEGAEEIVMRALMGETEIHGDDRIEENLEIGRSIARGMGGDGRGKVSTCREAHDAHIIRINMPLGGMATHGLHSLFGIRDWDKAVAVRHAVFEHNKGDTLIIEECSPLVTLMIHGKVCISTARAADHSTPRGTLGIRQINSYFCVVVSIRADHCCPFGP